MTDKKISLFNKDNYMWMIIGAVVMVLGLILMFGGKSSDPGVFEQEKVFSATRITVAPLLFFGGLMIEIYAIMKKPKESK